MQGRILLIASEAGVRVLPSMLHYSVSKSAQISLARGLAQLTAGTGVTVNSVLAGPTWTEGVEKYIAGIAAKSGYYFYHIFPYSRTFCTLALNARPSGL